MHQPPEIEPVTLPDEPMWASSGVAYYHARTQRLELELENLRSKCEAEARDKEIWRQQAQKLMQAWDDSEQRVQLLASQLAAWGGAVLPETTADQPVPSTHVDHSGELVVAQRQVRGDFDPHHSYCTPTAR
jgi:hypothetical protein